MDFGLEMPPSSSYVLNAVIVVILMVNIMAAFWYGRVGNLGVGWEHVATM